MNHDFTPFSSDPAVVDLLRAGIGRILTNHGETVSGQPAGALQTSKSLDTEDGLTLTEFEYLMGAT